MRRDLSKKLTKKENIVNVIENKDNIEFLCKKNNTTFFVLFSHNKKHPMNLTLGCLFDFKILDYFDFEVTNFLPMSYFKTDVTINSDLKPIIIFQGELFESDFNYDRLKKFFIDFFQLYDKENISISEMRRIIAISIEKDEKIIKIRNYQINGNLNNKNNLSKIDLVEIGPSLDLKERKFTLGDEVLYKKTLSEIEKQLPADKFFRCHRTYLVGFRHIVSHTSTDVLFDNKEKALISRVKLPHFKKAFTDYIKRYNYRRGC